MKENLENEFNNVNDNIRNSQTFFYNKPVLTPNEEGNIVLMSKYSFGPIETFEYGINKQGEFYVEHVFPKFWPGDEELEKEQFVISKESLIDKMNLEIENCKNNGDNETAELYEEAVEFVDVQFNSK